MPENNDKTLLENLVMDAGGLEKLEAMIAGFNLFEAVGMRSQEIKHSATLAFLLNPSKPHGFGDYFLRRILKDITRQTDTKISPIDIDCADLSDAEVWCERKRIDILIVCKSAKLVIAIENKIYARESKEQLKTYDDYVNPNKEWEGYAKLFVFLTIDGDIAVGGSKGVKWASYTHGDVTEVLEASLQANKTNIGVDQEVLIRHYLELMRRHILPDSDTAKLARDIYRKHKQALDLIIEHRPDLRDEVSRFLSGSIISEPLNKRLSLAHISTNYFRFIGNNWNFSDEYKGKVKAFNEIGFAFEINLGLLFSKKLKIELVMADIPDPYRRKQLHESVYDKLDAKNISGRKNEYETDSQEGGISSAIHRRIWVTTKTLAIDSVDSTDVGEVIEAVDKAWQKFVNNDLNSICEAVTEALNDLKDAQQT